MTYRDCKRPITNFQEFKKKMDVMSEQMGNTGREIF